MIQYILKYYNIGYVHSYKILYTTNEGYNIDEWDDITNGKKMKKSSCNSSKNFKFVNTEPFGKSQLD